MTTTAEFKSSFQAFGFTNSYHQEGNDYHDRTIKVSNLLHYKKRAPEKQNSALRQGPMTGIDNANFNIAEISKKAQDRQRMLSASL